jgi:alkanesulfonate monooxygenase SsuD/methylene tetrahydromethanopterin reductase-like flavin-dependent oxidoreductase (luciferase family)
LNRTLNMQFGIFDHTDQSGVPLAVLYEDRLRLAEVYDRAGFYCYHIAEHHGTPLGAAGSPSVLLAAVAQRTKRLRFGPLVYVLSTSHPLRIFEEICMLDQMSRGRLDVGIGRGTSPYEMGYFGVDAASSLKRYTEAFEVIMRALKAGAGGRLDFEGEHYKFEDVPVVLSAYQQPCPPLWYGLSSPDALPWVVLNGINVVCNGASAPVRAITDRYRSLWAERPNLLDRPLPKLGLGRHLMVADSYREAFDIGKRAFKVWYDHLQHLWRAHGKPLTRYPIPEDFQTAVDAGIVIVGTPGDVIRGLEREIESAGVNYVLTRYAYGDLSFAESSRSLDLFVREVMPHFAQDSDSTETIEASA